MCGVRRRRRQIVEGRGGSVEGRGGSGRRGGEKKGVEGREGRGGSMEEERSRVQEYKTNSK